MVKESEVLRGCTVLPLGRVYVSSTSLIYRNIWTSSLTPGFSILNGCRCTEHHRLGLLKLTPGSRRFEHGCQGSPVRVSRHPVLLPRTWGNKQSIVVLRNYSLIVVIPDFVVSVYNWCRLYDLSCQQGVTLPCYDFPTPRNPTQNGDCWNSLSCFWTTRIKKSGTFIPLNPGMYEISKDIS